MFLSGIVVVSFFLDPFEANESYGFEKDAKYAKNK